MDFSFTQDQNEMRSHIRDLLEKVCPPEYVEKCDKDGVPPYEAYKALCDAGWIGLIIPEEFGGAGGSATDLAILLEEIGNKFEELAMWVFRTMTWGAFAIMKHGTNEQKNKFLPMIAKGQLSFAFGLTEPESGSDAAALTTKADLVDGKYIINGQKVFSSGMDISDYCLVVLRTSKEDIKQKGITTLMVDVKSKGIEIRKIETLGHRSIGTTQVFYNDVEVSEDSVIGGIGNGWKVCDSCLWYERLCLSAARTGAATACFDLALDYAKNREQFGKPIGKFQGISHKIADMKVMLELSRILFYKFAWSIDQGTASRHEAAILKLYSSESYKSIADISLQVFGGYGYCMEYPVQRYYRDARLSVIGAGTSEIQRNIIAKSLGL
ncbi:acyl-CoA/acyl-ACP dehydrogenase [Hyphomicrobiales bacterium]|jgi:acyl-CoA dehydrogenase|nr:acyl-CoA/acyl-ACP dehydrogenase [Hyphomicrobiales bacterium]